MKKALKFGFFGLVALLLLGAAGVIFFLASFNPNDYKDFFSRTAHKATGRVLVFEGDIALALFPELSLKSGRLILKDTEDFGPEAFAVVESAVLRLPLRPLLEGVIALDELTLNGLSVTLAVNAAGQKNWQTGFGKKQGTGANTPKPQPDSGAQDAQTPAVEPLQAPEAEARESDGRKFSLHLERIACSGVQVRYRDHRDASDFSATVRDIVLQNPELGKDIPLDLSGTLADNNSSRRAAYSLKAQVRVAADASVDAKVEKLALTAEGLTDAPLNLEARGEIIHSAADGAVSLRHLSGALTLSPARDKAFACAFEGSAGIRPGDAGRPPDITAALSLDALDLDALLTLSTPEAGTGGDPTGAPNMPRPRAAASGQTTPGQTTSGQTTSGQTTSGQAAPAQKAAASGSPKLDGITADVDVHIGSLTIKEQRFSHIRAQVILKDAKADMPFSASLHDGALRGRARLDAAAAIPALSLTAELKNLDLERATASLTGKYSITGRASAKADVQASGADAHAMLGTLKGTASVNALSGEVRGFALIPVDLPGLNKAVPDSFSYTQMSASANIASGIATSKDILLLSPVLGGRGGGVIRLVQGQMDLGIDFMLGNLPPAVPVSISGPFANLSYAVDMPTFLRNVAQGALDAPGSALDLLRKTPQSAVDLLREPQKAKGVLRDLGGQILGR